MRPAQILGMCAALALVSVLVHPAAAEAAKAPTPAALRARVLTLVNQARSDAGCHPVRHNAALQRAAQKHTVRMARARTMSHQLPGEAGMASRVESAGYRRWRTVGENVAVGYRNAAAVMRAWMHSPGHRANILNCAFRDLGVGVTPRGGKLWFTQDFGRR